MKQMTAPLRRINRAKKRLDVLNREMRAFLASQPYIVDIYNGLQDGTYVLRPYLTKGFPITWGLLLGEVAHGLRSALDNIAWALAIERGERTIFPIYIDESEGFINRLKKLRYDIWDDVKAVQPYNRPDGTKHRHPLWLLRRIDNIDKHRIILPCMTKIKVSTGLSNSRYYWWEGFTNFNEGDVELTVTIPPERKKDFQPNVRAEIIFGISSLPIDNDPPLRISGANLFEIYNFVRDDVYPRFAKSLEPIDGLK